MRVVIDRGIRECEKDALMGIFYKYICGYEESLECHVGI